MTTFNFTMLFVWIGRNMFRIPERKKKNISVCATDPMYYVGFVLKTFQCSFSWIPKLYKYVLEGKRMVCYCNIVIFTGSVFILRTEHMIVEVETFLFPVLRKETCRESLDWLWNIRRNRSVNRFGNIKHKWSE